MPPNMTCGFALTFPSPPLRALALAGCLTRDTVAVPPPGRSRARATKAFDSEDDAADGTDDDDDDDVKPP